MREKHEGETIGSSRARRKHPAQWRTQRFKGRKLYYLFMTKIVSASKFLSQFLFYWCLSDIILHKKEGVSSISRTLMGHPFLAYEKINLSVKIRLHPLRELVGYLRVFRNTTFCWFLHFCVSILGSKIIKEYLLRSSKVHFSNRVSIVFIQMP